jgi:LacI family transcriptional regulator
LSVPGDVSVVAHDDGLPDLRAEEFDPPLTVTRAPLTDACAPLAAALLDLIDGTAAEALQIEVRAPLILRRSTGPAPKDGALRQS